MPRTLIPATILITMGAGCYSTTELGGDAHSDATTDTAVDTGHDSGPDTPADTAPDVGPDVAPDVVPDGPSACMPPDPVPDGPSVSFTIDDEIRPDWTDIARDCTVAEVSEEMGNWTVFLTCPDPSGLVQRHKIDILVQPHVWLMLWEGEEVTFRYVAQPIWWVNQWFSLTQLGSDWLLAGGIQAEYPTPPDRSMFFSPLTVGTQSLICDPEPGGCYDPERVALALQYYSFNASVLDSTYGYIGEWDDYGVHVDEALHYHDIRCEDVPGGWYSALIFQTGRE
jgi:hypothetical protein